MDETNITAQEENEEMTAAAKGTFDGEENESEYAAEQANEADELLDAVPELREFLNSSDEDSEPAAEEAAAKPARRSRKTPPKVPESSQESGEGAEQGSATADAKDAAGGASEPETDAEAGPTPTRNYRQIMAENRARYEEWQAGLEARAQSVGTVMILRTAMRQRRILNGTIVSVSAMGEDAPSELSPIAVAVMCEGTIVHIPFEEIYRSFPIDMTTVNRGSSTGRREFARRETAMAEKLYGLPIPFIITSMEAPDNDPANAFIIGSRREALAIIEAANYEPDRFGNVAVKVGDIVDGQIMAISEHSVQVNVGGVDSRVWAIRLSNRYLPNGASIKEHFYVGQMVKFLVKNIKTDSAGQHRVELSATEAELEAAKRKQGVAIKVGTHSLATITGVFQSKTSAHKVIKLYLDAYEMPAYSNSFPPTILGRLPSLGDVVRIQVAAFHESGHTRVNIIGVQDNAGTLRR